MTKYQPLEDHLRTVGHDCVRMSFAEIEEIIGSTLPPSARRHRAWWSNNPSNSVITYAWLNAGFNTADVDMAGERLVFRRDRSARPRSPGMAAPAPRPTAPMPATSKITEAPIMPTAAPAMNEVADAYAPQSHSATDVPGAPHALFGRLRAAVRVLAGVDVAVPADPGWADTADGAGRAG